MITCNDGARPYDSESVWMSAFFGRLAPRNDGTLRGDLVNFDQTAFGANPATNSMDTNGYAYVPRSCASPGRDDDRGWRGNDDGCGLVVAFHGCLQTQADIGTKFVTESGINEWADTNRRRRALSLRRQVDRPDLQPARVLGLVGLRRPELRDEERHASVEIVYKMIQHLTAGSPSLIGRRAR